MEKHLSNDDSPDTLIFSTVTGKHWSATIQHRVTRLMLVANGGPVQAVPRAVPRRLKQFHSNQLAVTEELGHGQFGKVEAAIEVATGQLLAIKSLRPGAGQLQHFEMKRVCRSLFRTDLLTTLSTGNWHARTAVSSSRCTPAWPVWWGHGAGTSWRRMLWSYTYLSLILIGDFA